MRVLAPESHSTHNGPLKAITSNSPYVLKIINLISFRINTYTVAEASLKTRYLKPFRMNTYRKSPANTLQNEHLQKK